MRPESRRTTRRSAGFVLRVGLTVAALAAALPASVAGEEPAPFRVGFSRSLFSDVNDSDARAAIMLWARTVARERGIRVDPSAQMFDDPEEIAEALAAGAVDAASVTFSEHQVIAAQVATGPWFVTRTSGDLLEEYVLLVHQESGFESVESLEGGSVALHTSARTGLAPDWLDWLVVGEGHGDHAPAFFGEIRREKKASAAVLPVFFGTADAGVVTESGFSVLRDLNPQLGRKLRVLARSQPLVPAVMAFRKDFDSTERDAVLAALNELHTTPAGQQVLNLFQSDALVQIEAGPLAATEAFLVEVRARRKEAAP